MSDGIAENQWPYLMKEKQAELKQLIENCKLQYRDKIKDMVASQDIRQAWNGLQKASGYNRGKSKMNVKVGKEYADQLNNFYCRFDSTDYQEQHDDLRERLSGCTTTLIITVDQVRNGFKRLNKRKASGPNNISAMTLKSCADELAPITIFFN